jgi:membrane protease YdiL (CAAX protease family)
MPRPFRTFVAWTVIVALGVMWVKSDDLAGFVRWYTGLEQSQEGDGGAAQGGADAAAELQPGTDGQPGDEDRPGYDGPIVGDRQAILGRITLAMSEWMPAGDASTGLMLQQQYASMATSDDPVDRLCAAALDARFGDPVQALETTRELAVQESEWPEFARAASLQADVIAAIIRSQQGDATAGVDPALLESLQGSMGWYGVFLSDMLQPDPSFRARESASAIRILAALGGFGCLVAIGGLIGLVWLAIAGWRAVSHPTALARAPRADDGDRYAWTFVCIFGVMLALNLSLSVLLGGAGATAEPAPEAQQMGIAGLAAQMLVMAIPLVGLAWALRGGRSWSQVRQDVGLTSGGGVVREVGYGVLTWCAAVPLAAVGFVIAFILSALTGQSVSDATHPIQEAIAEGGIAVRIALLMLAAVFAPLVEEIVFRGVLYRHLRERLGVLGPFASFMMAALASSALFAAIHPQGIVFAPILAGLGFAFCIARELRGSLIAPMVAHGINNALIVGLNVALFS